VGQDILIDGQVSGLDIRQIAFITLRRAIA
jgi:hypothetical protein